GRTWLPANVGLTASAFRCIAPDPLNSRDNVAGTEPARIFRSHNGGRSWQELGGVTQNPRYGKRDFPYSPRARAGRNAFRPPGRAASTRRREARVAFSRQLRWVGFFAARTVARRGSASRSSTTTTSTSSPDIRATRDCSSPRLATPGCRAGGAPRGTGLVVS